MRGNRHIPIALMGKHTPSNTIPGRMFCLFNVVVVVVASASSELTFHTPNESSQLVVILPLAGGYLNSPKSAGAVIWIVENEMETRLLLLFLVAFLLYIYLIGWRK